PVRFSEFIFTKLFMMLSYLHITLSFALSDAQPAWVTRWFKPQPQSKAPSGEGEVLSAGESRLGLPLTSDPR
ncbi:MAG: hypothetical protein ACREH5_03485, partial [Candidatus Omnitrophota bacterium]